jgi:hypothetical protein
MKRILKLRENINNLDEMKAYLDDIYIISNIMRSEVSYDDFYCHIYAVFGNAYVFPECRYYRINFKLYSDDQVTYSLPFNRFIINLIYWNILRPVWNKTRVPADFILNDDITWKIHCDILDSANVYLTKEDVEFHDRNYLQSQTTDMIHQVTCDFADMINMTLSFETCFLDSYRSNEKVREICNIEYPNTMSPNVIKKDINLQTDCLIQLFKETNNPIYRLMKSGTNIKRKQFQEIFINYEFMPDLYGNLMLRVMNGNSITSGFKKVGDYFLAATGSRMATIISHTDMGNAGYLARNIWLLVRTLTLSQHMYECGTKHYVKYKVKTIKHLQYIIGKNYNLTWGAPLKTVSKKDTHLVGKEIFLRSMITCAGENEVCPVCYGEDYKLVEDLPGMSTLLVQGQTEKLSQDILSVKHLINSNTVDIKTSEIFSTLFSIIGDSIQIQSDIDVNRYILSIREDNLKSAINTEVDTDIFGQLLIDHVFGVYDTKEKIMHQCQIDNLRTMEIPDTVFKKMKIKVRKDVRYYEVKLSTITEIQEDDSFANYSIKNKGVTNALYELTNILKYNSSKYTSYDDLVESYIDLCIEAKINIRFIQIEVLLNRLLRDKNNNMYRPQFQKMDVQYEILTLGNAILRMNDVLLGLSYQEIVRQLIKDTTFEKDGQSYLNAMFLPELEVTIED